MTGAVDLVLLRGRVLVDGDELVGSPGMGRFVRRARFDKELASAGAAVTA